MSEKIDTTQLSERLNVAEIIGYVAKIKRENTNLEDSIRLQEEYIKTLADHYGKKLQVNPATVTLIIKDILHKGDAQSPEQVQEVVNRCLGAIKMMSPKLAGLEARENDNTLLLKTMNNTIKGAVSTVLDNVRGIDDKIKRLDNVEKTMLALLGTLQAETNSYRIPKLSFLLKNGLKWISKKLKISLKSKSTH